MWFRCVRRGERVSDACGRGESVALMCEGEGVRVALMCEGEGCVWL